jgi:hypothetical protein
MSPSHVLVFVLSALYAVFLPVHGAALAPRLDAGLVVPTDDACGDRFLKLKQGDSSLNAPPTIRLRTADKMTCFASATTTTQSAVQAITLQQGEALYFPYQEGETGSTPAAVSVALCFLSKYGSSA